MARPSGPRSAHPLREGGSGERWHPSRACGMPPLCRDDGAGVCQPAPPHTRPGNGSHAVPVAAGAVALADGVTVSLSACGMNVHHRCQTKVANLCGINQKLMAEALAMIESTQQVGTPKATRPLDSNSARTTDCSLLCSSRRGVDVEHLAVPCHLQAHVSPLRDIDGMPLHRMDLYKILHFLWNEQRQKQIRSLK